MKKFLLTALFYILYTVVIAQSESTGYFENIDIALKKVEQVKHLNLMYNNLEKFPVEIFQFYNLEVLDISHNKLKEVPEEISSLKKLRALYINHNQIEKLPVSLVSMNNLEILYLQVNPINEDEHLNSKVPSRLKKYEAGNPPKDFENPTPKRVSK